MVEAKAALRSCEELLPQQALAEIRSPHRCKLVDVKSKVGLAKVGLDNFAWCPKPDRRIEWAFQTSKTEICAKKIKPTPLGDGSAPRTYQRAILREESSAGRPIDPTTNDVFSGESGAKLDASAVRGESVAVVPMIAPRIFLPSGQTGQGDFWT
jgi:hypothetical protein